MLATPTTAPAATPRLRSGSLAGILVLLLALAAASALSLAIGSRSLGLGTVLSVLLHPDGSEAATVIYSLRVPRTLIAVGAGLCLGAAGALMQGHTRNPLAEPGLLGVSAGASFAVVVGIAAFGVTNALGYAWFALIGAGAAAAAVFAIGSGRRGPDPISLVLAGAAVSALLLAGTQSVLLRDVQALNSYRFWAVGSVSGRDLDVFWQVLPFMVLGLVIAAVSTTALNLLQLGDDVAISLGLHPRMQKVIGITAVMLLTGAATAACGPIAFLGLVVPHIARYLAGVDYRWVVPYSALLGALLLLLADVLGRIVARPGELQVGIVMVLVGGPVFIHLVRRLGSTRI